METMKRERRKPGQGLLDPVTGLKECGVCLEKLTADKFTLKNRAADRLQSNCQDCQNGLTAVDHAKHADDRCLMPGCQECPEGAGGAATGNRPAWERCSYHHAGGDAELCGCMDCARSAGRLSGGGGGGGGHGFDTPKQLARKHDLAVSDASLYLLRITVFDGSEPVSWLTYGLTSDIPTRLKGYRASARLADMPGPFSIELVATYPMARLTAALCEQFAAKMGRHYGILHQPDWRISGCITESLTDSDESMALVATAARRYGIIAKAIGVEALVELYDDGKRPSDDVCQESQPEGEELGAPSCTLPSGAGMDPAREATS